MILKSTRCIPTYRLRMIYNCQTSTLGVVWPIESMPKVLRDIAYVMPETLACESMRSMLSRGWGITHPAVWPGFVSSIVWSMIFYSLAILLARVHKRK